LWGGSVRAANFRRRYGVLVLAVHRQGANLREMSHLSSDDTFLPNVSIPDPMIMVLRSVCARPSLSADVAVASGAHSAAATALRNHHSSQDQAQAARICSACTTCPAEPVKLNLNFPARRVTSTLIVFRPLFFIRKRSCL
jgi:hypothetical protein